MSVQSDQNPVSHALKKIDACWKDRIYSPLITLLVFLTQV